MTVFAVGKARDGCIGRQASYSSGVKVVKQQVNGADRVVLKENATAEDLKAEAMRLKKKLGYEVQPDKRRGTYLASHSFFRGKFILSLEPD